MHPLFFLTTAGKTVMSALLVLLHYFPAFVVVVDDGAEATKNLHR